MSVVIREALPDDLPAVLELWKELMDFHGELDPLFTRSADGCENFLKHVESGMESGDEQLFVAEEDGGITGYIKVGINSYPPVFQQRKYGFIADAAVTAAHRRGGIGEALVRRAMEWFSEKGMSRVELRFAAVNPVAEGFWRKMGFEPCLITMFRETR